jgi:hypothetical protein
MLLGRVFAVGGKEEVLLRIGQALQGDRILVFPRTGKGQIPILEIKGIEIIRFDIKVNGFPVQIVRWRLGESRWCENRNRGQHR